MPDKKCEITWASLELDCAHFKISMKKLFVSRVARTCQTANVMFEGANVQGWEPKPSKHMHIMHTHMLKAMYVVTGAGQGQYVMLQQGFSEHGADRWDTCTAFLNTF
jgi:hypothetical protein